jgi:hypothetical protein
MQRQQYHTFLKLMVNQGKCPDYILKKLPRTNIHRWINHTKFENTIDFGLHPTQQLNTVFEGIQQAPTFYYSLVKIHLLLLSVFRQSTMFFQLLKTHQQQIVHTIGNSKNHLSLKLTCRLFGLSTHTYKEWKTMVGVFTYPPEKEPMFIKISLHFIHWSFSASLKEIKIPK